MAFFRLLIGIIGLFSFLQVSVAQAEVSEKEVSALMNILKLSGYSQAGPLRMAVVYDERSKESVAEKEQVLSITGSHYESHGFDVMAMPLASFHLDGLNSYQVLFLTKGLREGVLSDVNKLSNRFQILTMTTEMSYVKNANCVLGVSMGETFEVMMNKEAYQLAGLSFNAALSFMVAGSF